MAKSLISFEADSSIAEIASTLRHDGGVILKNLVPYEVVDQIYSELQGSWSAEE